MNVKNTVLGAAGMFICHEQNKRLEVLVGRRKTEPWKGFLMTCFAGTVERDDMDIRAAAKREAMQETGGRLVLGPPEFLSLYGPQPTHGHLELVHDDPYLGVRVVPLKFEEVPGATRFMFAAYYARYMGGEPRGTRELECPEFQPIGRLAQNEDPLAFNQAEMLLDLWERFRSGKVTNR